MESFVGLGDYPVGSPIHAMMSGAELDSLQKALTTGSSIVTAGATGGQSFRVQSLDMTLKVAMERSQKELPLWTRLRKDPAFSTVEEFSRLDDWGTEQAAFVGEVPATLPEQEGTYSRQIAVVKFLVIKKEVSFATTLVRNIVDPVAQMTQEGTMQLLRKMEWGLMFGDATENAYEFDGFVRQIDAAATGANADIVLDWEGNPPDEDMLEAVSTLCAEHYGYCNMLLLNTRAKRDLTRALFPKQRIAQPPNAEGRYGSPLNEWEASNGAMEVVGSRYVRLYRPLADAQIGAPSAITGATLSTEADATSKMEAKTYYYWLSATKNGAESAYYSAGSASPAVGEKVKIRIADAEWGGTEGNYARVYRSTTNSVGTASLIGKVANNAGGNSDFYDLNGVGTAAGVATSRDNCTDAVGFTFEPEVVGLKQLAPLMKMDLAQVTTSLPFLLLLYAVPVLFVPTKCVHIKNIGLLPLTG